MTTTERSRHSWYSGMSLSSSGWYDSEVRETNSTRRKKRNRSHQKADSMVSQVPPPLGKDEEDTAKLSDQLFLFIRSVRLTIAAMEGIPEELHGMRGVGGAQINDTLQLDSQALNTLRRLLHSIRSYILYINLHSNAGQAADQYSSRLADQEWTLALPSVPDEV